MDRPTDRQRYINIERQKVRKTIRWIDNETERQIVRETERERDRERERKKNEREGETN